MGRSVKGGRAYDASGRREQARRNRWAVLEAARERFIGQGYAATTMAEIAEDAGLSVESVYKMFQNKPGLLKAVFDVTLAGDDEPIPMADREDIQGVLAEPDAVRKIALFADHIARTLPRIAPVQLLVRAAADADPAVEAVWRQTKDEFLDGMTHFARDLEATGALKPGLDVTEARDLLWSFFAVELYELLVLQRGWAPARYASVVAEALQHTLVVAGGVRRGRGQG